MRCMLPPTVVCVEEVAARRLAPPAFVAERVPVAAGHARCRPGSAQDVVIRCELPR